MKYHQEQLELHENSISLKQKWTGKNSTCCDDRIYFTHQKHKFLIIVFLLIVQATLYQLIFMTCHYYELILSIISISLLIDTYVTDPGVIPKIVITAIIKRQFYKYEDDSEKLLIPQSTKKKEIQHVIVCLQSHTIRLKYCPTCKIYRPSRVSHCGFCNNCNIRFDHHCNWIGTCIGKRNIRSFYLFLFTLNLLFITEIIMLVRLYDFLNCIPCIIMSSLIFIITLLTFVLFSYHTFLLFNNITTNEHLKKMWKLESGNPFDKGSIFKNFADVICKRKPKKIVYLEQKLLNKTLKTRQDKVSLTIEMSQQKMQID